MFFQVFRSGDQTVVIRRDRLDLAADHILLALAIAFRTGQLNQLLHICARDDATD